MDELHKKWQALAEYIKSLGSVIVSFSAGVDSTFLLKAAHDLLGENAVAVTAKSCSFPQRELDAAKEFCCREKIRHVIVESEELAIEGFAKNPKNRCYLCKRELFTKIREVADSLGIKYIAEGSNIDDNGDYRPGLTAVAEMGIKSPLREAGLAKADIRALSKEMGLDTWNKPSFACLASRFPYGEDITEEKLAMVDAAEQKLMDMGFRQVRVRIHGNIARVEIEPSQFHKILENGAAGEIDCFLKGLGFTYVALDLGGYKMGSMNKTLD